MDARHDIYEAPAEEIPAEDTARLDGYLHGHAEQTRIDQDAPKGDEAYVIRIESADGRRLRITASDREAANASLAPSRLRQMLHSKAEMLIDRFLADG